MKTIVLVHGMFSSGSIFWYMKRKLKQNGYRCYCPDLKPMSGRFGIDDLAQKLRSKIDDTCAPTEKFILIGFSMGGIVSRYYLQQLDGAKRVQAFFSISVPHNGTFMAHFVAGLGAAQMRPNSPFLSTLNADSTTLSELKLFSYRTPFDLSIRPSTSSIWSPAENKKFLIPTHTFMVFNRSVVNEIISQLQTIEA